MYPINGMYNPYSAMGNPYMMRMMNPYMMRMMNPYMMMAMPPQTLEQFKNKGKITNELQMKQISFMGKINPFFSLSKDTRLNMHKSLFDYQADFSENYNPYAKKNIANTKQMMETMSDYQMKIMMNPFAMYGGYPVMV